MSAAVEQLITILEESEKMYEELLPVLNREKSAAYQSDPDRFSAVVEEKEELLSQLVRLEHKRVLILEQLSTKLNIPAAELRLSMLAEKVVGPQSSKIRRLRTSLNGLIQNVKRCNEENRLLIQHCLGIVHGALGFFHKWMAPRDVYGATGQMNMHQNSGRMVSGSV